CQQPPRLVFAELLGPLKDSYTEGDRVRYRCRPGYTMMGGRAPLLMCQSDSSWSENPDFCIGKPCEAPDVPNGQFHFGTDLRFGARVNYSCNTG
ncbi:CR1L protein, partial [Turnix velox]|nr:CR1L protein [Turnix velox]